MSKILSQAEIDALLTSATDLARSAGDAPEGADDSVLLYNFRRPDRISKDQIRSLQFLHDRFARNVATSISAYLRAVTNVSVTSVEQLSYSEFLMSLPDPTAFYAVSMDPLDGLAALELNPAIAFSLIDRMLGGSGRGGILTRALTEIEQNVIDDVVKLILENLTESWRAVREVHFQVSSRETRPEMLHVAAPNEVVVHLGFDVRLGETRGMLNLSVPASAIESIGTGFAHPWNRTHREPTTTDRRHLLGNLGRVTLPIAATLDTRLKARDLLKLRSGDVVSLGVPVGDALDVRVRGTVKFRGHLAAMDGGATVRIDKVKMASGGEA